MNIAICDDDAYVLQKFKDYLIKYSFLHEQDPNIVVYNSAAALLASKLRYDVLFLDIMLEDEQDGIEIAKRLRETDSTPILVFISSRTDRHSDAIDAVVFKYMVKPVSQEDVFQVMDKIYAFLKKNERIFPIHFGQAIEYVLLRDIILIESYGSRKTVVVKGREQGIATGEPWHVLIERAGNELCFYKIKKMLLINFHHMQRLTHSEVVMDNGRRILLNKSGYYRLQEAYARFLGGVR